MGHVPAEEVIVRQPTASGPTAVSYAHIPPPPPPPVPAPGAPYAAAVPSGRTTRGSRRRGRVLGGALVAALALGAGGVALAARGDDAAASPLAAAAARTEAAKSARVEVRIGGSALPGEVTMSGVVDFDAPASQLQLDLGALAGDAELFGRPLAPGDTRLEIISSGTAVYLKMGALADLLDRGPAWVKIDTARLPAGSAPLGEGVPQGSFADPAAMLTLLREHADSVTEVGREPLDGAMTTHHTAVFDLARLARSSSSVPEADLEELLEQLDDPTLTYDLWIGDDGYVHRMVVRTSTAEGELTVEVRLRDFGAVPAVEVPADGEVFDITSLVGR